MTSADRYKKMYPISWEQLQHDCRVLSQRLMEKGRWQGIIAITRGGLVPAAIIARELEIRHIDTICLSTYDWQNQGSTNILKTVPHSGDGFILIDDLVDTGKTAKIAKDLVPKAYFATVYAKPSGRPQVDTFITEVSQDTWILFPWDSAPQFVKPLSTLD